MKLLSIVGHVLDGVSLKNPLHFQPQIIDFNKYKHIGAQCPAKTVIR
jgi:hypothetical protein